MPLTENLMVLQSHLPKTKESTPRDLPSAPQVQWGSWHQSRAGGRAVHGGSAFKWDRGQEQVVQTIGQVFKPMSMCVSQAPFVKNPSQTKFLLRLLCRSLHFGLCFSPLSRSSNLPCLWKCLRHLRPPPTHPHHLHHHPHRLEKMGRSRKWRWKMKGVRSHLPQEQRRMLP